MGICQPQRIAYLKKTLSYLDGQKFPFSQKVLAIDEFDGYTFPKNLKTQLGKRGWTVLIDSHRSRIKSMDHAFSAINTDYVFYNEDDVQATLPKISDLTRVFDEIKVKDRECGMISLTLGGSKSHFPANKYGDLDKVKENILLENKEYLVFRRLEEKRNEWFFEFPALFIKTKLFKICHEVAKKKYHNAQVEMGLTKAWFGEKLDKKYYKCSLCKKDILHVVGDNPLEIFKKSRLITTLDPNQGNSPFGGHHAY
jgi:hypothetical protein